MALKSWNGEVLFDDLLTNNYRHNLRNMSEKEASFRMYQEDALKKDWLTTYPLPESGLSIEGVRSMGLEAATKKLFEIWGGGKRYWLASSSQHFFTEFVSR